MKRAAHVLMAAMLQVTAGCREAPQPGGEKAGRPVVENVSVTEVRSSAADQYYETAGTLKAVNTSVIAARIMAPVASIAVAEGDRVAAGQVLAVLDDRDLSQKVRAAEAAGREAEAALTAARQNQELAAVTLERYRNLFNGKAITRQELDEVETRGSLAVRESERLAATAQRAAAGLAETRTLLDFTRITAPFAGVIISKTIDPGSMAVPGQPLFTLADTSEMEVAAGVDERFVGRLQPGQQIDVEIADLGRSLTGAIKTVVPAVDPASRTFTVKIWLRNADLRPGLYARIRMALAGTMMMKVPRDALVHKGELTGVFVVGPERLVSYRLVRTGKPVMDAVEVLSGLSEGEKIITAGAEHAVDGGILAGSEE